MDKSELNKRRPGQMAAAALIGLALSTTAYGAPGGGHGGGGGGGGGGGETETGANNLSFPVVFSDAVAPDGFPVDGPWTFANVFDPTTQCIGEAGVAEGETVPDTIPCYYGRHVTVVSETGAISFDGSPEVWWLQQRTANFWKTFTVPYIASDNQGQPLAVSGVDVGDLLESSPSIATRQIRVEFNLLQDASQNAELSPFIVTDWSTQSANNPPPPCGPVPTTPGQSIGCFAAFGMSGPVPGTQQSINEIQGTNFGDGMDPYPGTRMLIDPTTVRGAATPDGTSIPIHAIDYSRCARLVIQRLEGTPVWDPATGQWTNASAPVVNVAAYNGTYPTEITSSGSLVYGYNWNASTAAVGTYRLTFVLDGNDANGPTCPVPLTTEFNPAITKLVNVGENNAPHIVYRGDPALNGGDEGGLVYIDLALSPKGGGSRGGGGRRP